MKRKNRVDAAGSKTPPVTETVTTVTTTERTIPLAQSAVERIAPLYQGVAAKAGPLAAGVAAAAGPLAQQAQQAYERAVPLATGAAAAAGPLAQQAYGRAVPLAGQALGAVTPLAHAAADRVAPLTEAASLRIAPVVAGGAAVAQDAVSKVGPAFGSARDRVADELLPRAGTALSTAAASPLAVEALKRGRATVAAARGELALPEEKPKSGSWVKRIAVVAALAGVAAVAVRALLSGSQDSGWQAARPSTPSPAPATPTSAPTTTTSSDDTVEDTAVVEEVAVLKPTSSTYGEGSYTGTEPPEGFAIKGNENSMKYHLPDSGGYEQTQSEVWFASEEAAERAGFTRAQS